MIHDTMIYNLLIKYHLIKTYCSFNTYVLILHNRKYYGLLNYIKIIIKLKIFISC